MSHRVTRGLAWITWILAASLALGKTSGATSPNSIDQAIQNALVRLPFYTVFDYLSFRLDDGTVTLEGEVTRADLMNDAQKAVRQVPGVTRVNNRVQVLPLSASDGRMRLAEYLAVYGVEGLGVYTMRPNPSIHIVVRNGNVTLEGTVDSAEDKALAFSQASSVAGVQSLTDHLRVKS